MPQPGSNANQSSIYYHNLETQLEHKIDASRARASTVVGLLAVVTVVLEVVGIFLGRALYS